MGWGSAGAIFETVADALIEASGESECITDVCAALIRCLSSQDWAGQAESLERYTGHDDTMALYVVKAFIREGHAVKFCDAAVIKNDGTLRIACSLIAGHSGKHTASYQHMQWEDES